MMMIFTYPFIIEFSPICHCCYCSPLHTFTSSTPILALYMSILMLTACIAIHKTWVHQLYKGMLMSIIVKEAIPAYLCGLVPPCSIHALSTPPHYPFNFQNPPEPFYLIMGVPHTHTWCTYHHLPNAISIFGSSLHSPTYSYQTPTGLPDSYWILLGLQQISYWLITIQIWYPSPTGVLVNSYWNTRNCGFLRNGYTGVQYKESSRSPVGIQ